MTKHAEDAGPREMLEGEGKSRSDPQMDPLCVIVDA